MKIKTCIAFVVLFVSLTIGALSVHAQSGRQANAIWIRDSSKIYCINYHISGVSAAASTARANIVDTAKCLRAQTSWYSDVGTTYVWLHSTMLSTMKTLASTYGYSYVCTALAGSDHSSTSYHYRGTAFDVSSINGRGISSSNPYWRTFNQRCRDRGAVEVLGPGYAGHDTHLHLAWPSGTSASSAGGCITEVKTPTSLNATTTGTTTIKLTWVDNASNESGFTIQRSSSSSTGPWTTVTSVGANVESYTCSGLQSGTRYWFHVRAYNSQDTSPWSNVDNATTKDTAAAAPTALTATAVSNDQINLAWTDNASNEDGFRIYRSADGTNFTQVTTVGINVKTYNNTGLSGNRKYWYKVCAYNTAGNSGWSNVASDTTAPQAPSSLVATNGAVWSEISLSWTDNASSEVGFKVERSTDNVTFTQIATNAASDRTYTDTGRAGTTKYYYRVRSYNGNGNSDYSNVASFTTPNSPPVLAAIGNKTVAAGSALTFTATATDPNQSVSTPYTASFESYTHGTMEVVFNKPANSASTSAFIDTAATNYSMVVTSGPSGVGGSKCLKAGWTFKTGQTDYWVRYNTYTPPIVPNLTVALDQVVKFRVYTTKKLKVGLGVRETGTTAAYGGNGGTTGTIEWVAVTNVLTGSKPVPNRSVNTNTWTTLTFNIPFEPQAAFTGDGKVDQSGAKGVLEHIILKGDGGTGAYVTYIDDLQVVLQNTLNYTLESGAPAGATIGRKNGKFSWTPTTGQAGTYTIGVRVTDQLGAIDNEFIKVTVTGTGNAAPALAAIGNKTVNEGSTVSFTASASDANAGQTLTYSLDVGAPAGASINTTSGAFTWTTTEAQGPGSYPITVRVTDNGSPASNDWETITVTVNEVNVAPVLAAIADQTVSEQSAFTFTPSATDSDVPAQTLTYALISGPVGMTINSSTGTLNWTPTDADGPDTNQVVIRVSDSGNPKLIAERTFNLVVNEANTAPVLTVGTTALAAVPICDFESFASGNFNGTIMFRQPSFSSSTTGFLDAYPNGSIVTDVFPEGVDGSRSLEVSFSIKTGTTSPWVRMSTFNTTAGNLIPNPTVDFTKKVRFSIYSDRSIKVALGIRETGTSAAVGADGGTTGTLEWLGATASGTSPVPSRVVEATNWTTLEFDLSSEVVTAFPGSGNGVLSSATGKGVLEHLAIVPNDGTGIYTVYLDNFEVMMPTTELVVDTGRTIILTNSAVDFDLPAQALVFSLEPGAPTNAVIDSKTGTLEWTPTPEQSPSTNVIGIRVTDDGEPTMSDVETVTIRVNAVNTAPRFAYYYKEFYVNPFETIEFMATATDEDLPGDTLTYTLVGSAPAGCTLDSTNGMFIWTPTSANGTNYATIRVTDNGTPQMWDELPLIIVVSPTNIAPTLTVSQARAVEPVVTFESFTNNTPNEQVMFKKPGNSSTTTNYIDIAATNYTTVTTAYPVGKPGTGSKVLKVGWTFKTGTSNYWVRLTTANTTFLPNPTINASARLKFSLYTTKALKVGLGIRETGTTAENGANGGTTGAIEYVGCSSKIGTTPIPTRSIAASNWTTLEFDLPTEPCQTMTGDSILAAGQQVLEHLILLGDGGTGAYTMYVDDFEVVSATTLPGTLTMKSGTTLTFTASGTDPDAHPLTYGMEEGAPLEASINSSTGAFTWTPSASYDGLTNEITVYVEDYPPGGYQAKRDAQTLTVIVQGDTLGALSAAAAANEAVTLEWEAVQGQVYQVQYQDEASGAWINLGAPVTAAESLESVAIESSASARSYRVIDMSGASVDQ